MDESNSDHIRFHIGNFRLVETKRNVLMQGYGIIMTAVRAIYFYKLRTQGMATEVRTGHVGVADPHL